MDMAYRGRWKAEIAAMRRMLAGFAMKEECKWGKPTYTVDGKNVVILQGFKEHFGLAFFQGALLQDPKKVLVQLGQVLAGRVMRFTSAKDITANAGTSRHCATLVLFAMSTRDFDVVLFGAAGFTGRQTVEYFARNVNVAQVRWAVAGRNRDKLAAVIAEIGLTGREPEILVADSRDQASIDTIAARTRVLLSTAGPFRQYGTALVDACVRFKTHHVNITGETTWVRAMIDRYHDRAASDGTRIVPFCGFDSIPSDIGAYLLARHANTIIGEPCREVRACFQMRGGVNGGTIATAFDATRVATAAEISDPFLLDPPGTYDSRVAEQSQDLRAPRYDGELRTWIGPFVMAPTNTRVVRRSAALAQQWGESYGSGFVYQEYLKFGPRFARAGATAATIALGLFMAALRRPLTRRILERVLPKPGTGPSRESIERGWFTCELHASTKSGKRLRGMIRHQGDPSNHATVAYVCESALALVQNTDALPGGAERGGILTPAAAFGNVLVDRLRAIGVQIEIESDQ